MTPRVSVIIRRDPAGDLPRCLASLLDQTLGAWEAIVVIPPGPERDEHVLRSLADDRRFTILRADPAGAFNAGVDRARGGFILFLDSRDWLAPRALAALVAVAERTPHAAAFGGFEHRGPEGERLGGSAALPGSFALADLLTNHPVPLHAQLFPRAVLAATPIRPDAHESNTACDLMLRLAKAGLEWSGADELVAYARLRPAAASAELRATLRRRHAMFARMGHEDCPAARDLRTALAMLSAASATGADINETAKALLRTAGDLAAFLTDDHPSGGGVPSPLVISPIVWWQRTGFIGPLTAAAVDHARVGLANVVGSHDRAPALILELAEAKAPRRPIVLLGLGRNGRRIAREMARRGMPIRARDDALTSPPDWARADGVSVSLIAPAEPWDAHAVHLMTLLDDEAFLRKVPPGVETIRWRDALARIDADRERWLASWEHAA